MPDNDLTITQSCGDCGHEVGSFSVKKDNMMLMSKELVWCPECQDEKPEVRDLAGRSSAIQMEQQSYAKNEAVQSETRVRNPA